MLEYDVVYILKRNVKSAELRYSLRSVEKNFPHGKVWFFCGNPSEVKPDKLVAFNQQGDTPWQKVRNSMSLIASTKGLSEDFWLFNDDFFVMQPVTKPFVYRGTTDLYKRAESVGPNGWTAELVRAADALKAKGYGVDDYALHVPFLLNKKRVLETLHTFHCASFRSLYGNHHKIGGQRRQDCKIIRLDTSPDEKRFQKFLSTSDEAFRDGIVGEYIRDHFPDKCRYEK